MQERATGWIVGEESGGRMSRRTRRMRDDFERGRVPAGATVAYFKERIYATFTGLAILLVVGAEAHTDASHALIALVLGVVGIVAAGCIAEVIAHLTVHQHLPDAAEWRMLGRTAAGALSTAIVPAILLLLALFDRMPVGAALRSATIVLLVTLVLIGWLAIRRSSLVWWQQLLTLVTLPAFGGVVILVQVLAHSA